MRQVNQKIFKAYDIRGVYPEEINEEAVESIGRAFAFWLERRIKKNPKVVLSRDARLSSPLLSMAAGRGLAAGGGRVVDCGLSTTPMHYFIVNREKADGGLMITASHNPGQYNGIKLSRRGAISLSETTGLQEIKKMVVEGDHPERSPVESRSSSTGRSEGSRGKKSSVVKKNYLSQYINFLAGFANPKISKLKIAVDAGSGMAGLVLPRLLKKLKIKYAGLCLKPDGGFPYHEANPMKEETLFGLQKLMRKGKYDLGLAFDGDGDRVVFLDETGKVIFASFILALAAREFLKINRGAAVVYDFRSSRIVPETVIEAGGRPVWTRVGHSFVKEKIRAEKAVFGGEFSGHYFFKDFFYADSALMMMIKVLNILAASDKKISELISPFQKYWHSGEINFRLKNDKEKEGKLKLLARNYKDGKISWPDGLLAEFPDFWFSVRPSNTEPLLRFVLEAKTKKLMEEKVGEIDKILKL